MHSDGLIKITVIILLLVCPLNFWLMLNATGDTDCNQRGRLVVYVSPPVIPADGRRHECVYIQVQNLDGAPLKLSSDLTVTLTSSNRRVGVVESPVVIQAGKSFSAAWFNSTLTAGKTHLTASAPGVLAGVNVLTAVNAYSAGEPLKLKVYAAPKVVLVNRSQMGRLSIQLLDSNGISIAASSDLNVTLTSSNTSVLTVPQFITIPKGSSYYTSYFRVKAGVGTARLSALAQDILPGYDMVSTVREGGKPAGVALTLTPSTLLPDSSVHQPIVVQLRDVEGNPTTAERDTEVYVTSSDVKVAVVEEKVTIKRGESFSTVQLRTTLNVGRTVITASAQGLQPANATLEVKGFIPSKLSLHIAPPRVIVDGEPKKVIAVQVQAVNGFPVPSRGVTVHLTSSSTDVGLLPSTTRIKKGESCALVSFTPTLHPGETNITASAQGLQSAEAKLITMELPLNVIVDAPPAVRVNQTVTIKARTTSQGCPTQKVSVTWNVVGAQVLDRDNVTGKQGIASLTVKQTSEALIVNVQAFKPGYMKVEARKTVQVILPERPHPLEINIFGFKIPVLTAMILTAVLAAGLTAILYVFRRKG